MPPDSSCGYLSSKPESPTSAMYLRAMDWRSAFPMPLSSRPKATLRMTVAHGIRAKSWNTKARSGPGPVTVRPLTRTPPEVGSIRPAMIFSNVVFPQPEGPRSVVSLPRGKSRSMLRSASVSPYFLQMPRTSTTASMGASCSMVKTAADIGMSALPLFRTENADLEGLEGGQRHGGDQNDGNHGGIHFGVVRHGAVIGDQIADAR